MTYLFAKLNSSETPKKYRKILDTDKSIFSLPRELKQNSYPYDVDRLLGESEWYTLSHFSQRDYSLDFFKGIENTVEFNSLTKKEFSNIDFIFSSDEGIVCFQNIGKSKLVLRKRILYFENMFQYYENDPFLTINDEPDAIYIKNEDKLYFRKISSITSIFRGIDQEYREATETEIELFFQKNPISLDEGFNYSDIKTANRKRIALASETLKHYNADEKGQIFSYIESYCLDLKADNGTFNVSNEGDLKLLLYGIEQRFYTTPVGDEKRIANSIILFNEK